MKIITHSLQETEQLGKDLAKKLQPSDIVLLYGDLGAGKTSFVKGIAQGFGVRSDITSPTFTLMNMHPTKHKKITTLVHIDTYRLQHENDLIEIGVRDYLGNNHTVTLIEWAGKNRQLA
jgi:tRNA threonylcarbamoyladenosine biosynthesis protein TsaE